MLAIFCFFAKKITIIAPSPKFKWFLPNTLLIFYDLKINTSFFEYLSFPTYIQIDLSMGGIKERENHIGVYE